VVFIVFGDCGCRAAFRLRPGETQRERHRRHPRCAMRRREAGDEADPQRRLRADRRDRRLQVQAAHERQCEAEDRRRPRIGAIIRPGVGDRQMVDGLGVNIGAVFTGVFAFGAALAAFGGVVAGPVLSLFPGIDAQVLINALIVVVVGGMGTLTGAFWGGLLIGVAVTFLTVLVPQVALVLTFLVMGVVLLIRPNGLFGMKLR